MMLFSVKRYLLNIISEPQIKKYLGLHNQEFGDNQGLKNNTVLSKTIKSNLFYKITFFKYKPRQIKTTETRKGLILIKSNRYSLTKNQDGIRKENGRQKGF